MPAAVVGGGADALDGVLVDKESELKLRCSVNNENIAMHELHPAKGMQCSRSVGC